MPEFKLRAIECGLFFNELSAACLHMAHWALTLLLKNSIKNSIAIIGKYFLNEIKNLYLVKVLVFGLINKTI